MNEAELATTMARCSGVAHIQDLLTAGYTRYQVAALHRTGKLLRPRIGWYVSPTHTEAVVRAVRAGGILDCISAASSYGLATPHDPRVHVGLAAHTSRLRSTRNGFQRVAAGDDTGIVRHWGAAEPHRRFRVELLECLETALSCVQAEWAVGVIDSALSAAQQGGRPLLSTSDLQLLRASVPPDRQRIIDSCSDKSESILESVLRVRLTAAGLNPIEQVIIDRFRVDFLIDGWLVIECDGATHAESERFASDRTRDAQLARSGRRVLRFTYVQIVADWAGTLETILSVLAQGRPRIR